MRKSIELVWAARRVIQSVQNCSAGFASLASPFPLYSTNGIRSNRLPPRSMSNRILNFGLDELELWQALLTHPGTEVPQ